MTLSEFNVKIVLHVHFKLVIVYKWDVHIVIMINLSNSEIGTCFSW